MAVINCSNPPQNWTQGQKRLTQLAAQFLSGNGHEPRKIDLVEFRVYFEAPALSDEQVGSLIDTRWPIFRDTAIRKGQQ